jgi:hypothetical protein
LALNETQTIILKILKKNFDDPNNTYGTPDKEIIKELNINHQKLHLKYINPLKKDGYIKSGGLDGTCQITPKGIDYVDNIGKEAIPTFQQNIYGDVKGNAIQGQNISTVNNFLQELEKAIQESPDLTPQEKQTWLDRIIEMTASVGIQKAIEYAITTLPQIKFPS